MKKFLIMLIAVAMLVSSAAAANDSATDAAALKDGYTVTWINSDKESDFQVKSVYQTITQGETESIQIAYLHKSLLPFFMTLR